MQAPGLSPALCGTRSELGLGVGPQLPNAAAGREEEGRTHGRQVGWVVAGDG